MLAAGGTAAGGRWGVARAVAVTVIGAAAIASSLVLSVASTRASDAVLADANPREVVRLAPDAASLNPLAIGALLAEARARAQLGDDAGAIRTARRATGRQPENPFAWECLAAVGGTAERAAATARLVRLDPQRDPTVAPRCRPGW
jgi:Flp pilus assembly protein TadD